MGTKHKHIALEVKDGKVNCAACGWVTGSRRHGVLRCGNAVREQRGSRRHKGYVIVTREGRQVREHRAIMEQILGRPLLSHENVHHINGVRHDNRPENLELWSTSQPPGQRVEDKIAWAKNFLAQYEESSQPKS